MKSQVMEQYEAVRRSGKTNMLDVDQVQVIAYESGYHELVTWIEDHSHAEYVEMAEESSAWFGPEAELSVEPVPETITREVEL